MALLYEKDSYDIRGAAFDVYKILGSGHKEAVYQKALLEAFKDKGLSVETEKNIDVYFKEKKVGTYVPDFVINNAIVVEIKAKPILLTHDSNQFWQYLTTTGYVLGLLINFGKPGGVEIIRRVHEKTSSEIPQRSALNSVSIRVALAHDTFTQLGGAERVVEALHEQFPSAPVFTLVVRQSLKDRYAGWNFVTSPLQRFYDAVPVLQYLLPLIPKAVADLDVRGFDLVLSSSSSFIKNIQVAAGTTHVCYCHTPTRFLWTDKDYVKQEVPLLLRPLAAWYLKKMKRWDLQGAKQVNFFIANSKEVQRRIREYYGRDSTVIYPPIDTRFWRPTGPKRDYFLLAGRLQAHKKNELVVKAFNELKLPLHVVGTGRQEAYLRSIAAPHIRFFGRVSDEELRDQYSGALGFLYPQIEDAGLMPLEAAACGTASIGMARGGSLETIVPGVTGELFDAYDQEAITRLVRQFQPGKYAEAALLEHAKKFDKQIFKNKIQEFLNASFNKL